METPPERQKDMLAHISKVLGQGIEAIDDDKFYERDVSDAMQIVNRMGRLSGLKEASELKGLRGWQKHKLIQMMYETAQELSEHFK